MLDVQPLPEAAQEQTQSIGVLKEGVFFDRTYTDLRKHLIKNYNLREVISVPQDQFENTKTKTQIIIFDNIEEKTTEVKFSEIVVERYLEDKFVELLNDITVNDLEIVNEWNSIVGMRTYF